MNIETPHSQYHDRHNLLRYAGITFFKEKFGPHALAVTFNFNRPTSVASARRTFGAFLARIDKHFVGKDFVKLPAQCRTNAIAVIENIDTNLHAHGFIQLPEFRVARRGDHWRLEIDDPGERQILFTDKIEEIWAYLVPSGSIDVQDMFDKEGWAKYITKQFSDPRVWPNVIFSAEYQPHRPKLDE